MAAQADLEEHIFNSSSYSEDDLRNYLSQFKGSDREQIFMMLNNIATIRPFHLLELLKIWEMLGEVHTYFRISNFMTLLYKKGMIKREIIAFPKIPDVSIEKLINVYDENTIELTISKDNLEQLTFLSSTPTFDSKKAESMISLAAFCGSIKSFNYLLLNGAHVSNECVQSSIKGGNDEIIELIVQKGISFDFQLNTALTYHRNEIANWLIENYECEEVIDTIACIEFFNVAGLCYALENNKQHRTVGEKEATMLHLATYLGQSLVVKYLLDKGEDIEALNNYGQTPLFIAAMKSLVDVAKILIKEGAKINATDNEGNIPLSLAAFDGNIESMELLLENGAEIDHKNLKGLTPMLDAARNGRTKNVEFFLQKGIDIESMTNKGETALLLAVSNKRFETTKYLIEHGAKKFIKNPKYPLFAACENGYKEIAEYLLEKGADINYCNSEKKTLLMVASCLKSSETVELLLSKGADMEKKDRLNRTALIYAILNQSSINVQCLVEHGARINPESKTEESPIHWAAQSNERILQYLIDNGANVNAINSKGQTPLMLAAMKGKLACASILMNNGADKTVRDYNCETAIDFARGKLRNYLLYA